MRNITRALTIAFILIMFSNTALALVPGYEGGISNEYQYREIIFITGRPVEVWGELKISESRRRDKITTRYSYTLENPQEDVKVSRSFTFSTRLEKKEDIGQTVATTVMDRASETISIAGDKYKLEDYIFNKSTVTHNKPVADFYSGNWESKKVYTINRNEGTVIVRSMGEVVGYKNYWSSTETQQVYSTISYERTVEDGEEASTLSWEGEVSCNVSVKDSREISYVENQPVQISFRGSYLQTGSRESVALYQYDLPRFGENGALEEGNRNKGSRALVLETVPTQKRLLIPELLDVAGHWAEDDIKKLYSLEILDAGSRYFGPGLPMLRKDFAKAVTRIAGLLEEEQEEEGEEEGQTASPVFEDVPEDSTDYKYIKEVYDRGIIMGTAPRQFSPYGKLTRVQAITIIIRSLGFESLAPTPGYSTGFVDDDQIPYWARDAVYAAKEIGLVRGDTYGYLHPNEVMTRAEAAAFLSRFMRYLQRDIAKDYRERILHY